MNFVNEKINNYAESHTTPESDVLRELNRETNAKVLMPRMLSGHLQGRVLSMISKMIRPKNILEIGTYTGYSAICLTEGLCEGGKLISIDINEEYKGRVMHFWKKAGIMDKTEMLIGPAKELIPSLSKSFDLVFIDADKENYSNYYKLLIDKLPAGSYIIADNVLWSGKVVDTKKNSDMETTALDEFNKMIMEDDRVENVLLPVRDGLNLIRKK